MRSWHPIAFSWADWQFGGGLHLRQSSIWPPRRLFGASGSGLAEADARLIAIGELDACCLKCTLQPVHCRLFRIRPVFDTGHGIGSNAGSFGELPHTPPDGGAGHPKLNSLHWYIVQIKVDMVPLLS
jgi:hypothetical protein